MKLNDKTIIGKDIRIKYFDDSKDVIDTVNEMNDWLSRCDKEIVAIEFPYTCSSSYTHWFGYIIYKV